MVEVDISSLDGEDKDGLADFVESKLLVKADRSGDTVTFEDKTEKTHVTSPEIRTYLKRYLHQKNLRKRYRVLGDGDGVLKFVTKPQEEDEEEDEEEEKESKK